MKPLEIADTLAGAVLDQIEKDRSINRRNIAWALHKELSADETGGDKLPDEQVATIITHAQGLVHVMQGISAPSRIMSKLEALSKALKDAGF